ncbi:M36 family metallopeptidase [Flavilitoribacter nigricans]|nr:M36 family metallopeptidase [Flavilitoribacter nigricans]
MTRIKLIVLALVIGTPGVSLAQSSTELARKQITQEWVAAGKTVQDLEELKLSSEHTSKISGITHFYFQQSYQGIPIHNAIGSIHLDPSGNIRHRNFQFYDALNQKIKTTRPAIDSERARAIALRNTGGAAERKGKSSFEKHDHIHQTPPPALRYVEDESGTLVLSYQVEVPADPESDDRLVLWVDAENGREIRRYNRTLYCHFAPDDHPLSASAPENVLEISETSTQNTTVSGSPAYYAFPLSVESPLQGNRQLLAGSDIIDPVASPYGWHGTGDGVEFAHTQGNNVYAYYAPLSTENPTPIPITRAPFTGTYLFGNVPSPGNLNFNYRRNLDQLAANNFIEDAVTNLFVRNNFLHDLLFNYGFDEAAGNFQTTNQSGAGLGNDHVLAQAQDGLGINQASFFTPADGESGRMRMFLWNTDLPNSTRDGSFDNLIISHEYAHGLSFRLVGGANNTTCLSNFEQGGEGWSDFIGLMMTLTDRNGDNRISENVLGEGVRAVGHFVLTQEETETGLRPRHYTTNMDCADGLCNEFTYQDLELLAPPHGVGFLWCTMLWDMTWGLIDEYGFEDDLYNTSSTAGNIRALKIVIEALKMTACSPSFIDMRDAIFAANNAIYAGEGDDILWAAFARRGLGYSAAPNGQAAFDDPYMQLIKTVDKTEAEIGEPVTYTLSITNHLDEPLRQTLISDQLPENFVVTYISDNGSQNSDGLVEWPQTTIPKKRTITRTITGHLSSNASPTTVISEYPVEPTDILSFVPAGAWLASSDFPNPNSNSTMSWFHLDPPTALEGSLVLTLNLDGSKNNHLSFWHAYDLEPGADAGVVEVLVGGEWQDLGRNMIQNGYTSIVLDELPTPIGVPVKFSSLSRRRVFSGSSQGYRQTIIDLSNYEGLTVLRFRFASNLQTDPSTCDGSTPGCDGWFIDDVQLLDLQNVPNTACASSAKSVFYACGDIGPIGTVFYPASGNNRLQLQAYEVARAEQETLIFPNPARNQMTVQLPVWAQDVPEQIDLLNGQGQVVDSFRIPDGENSLEIDGSQLPRGLYILSIQGKEQRSVHRIAFQ